MICLYHLMALVAAAKRCHSQGSLLFGISSLQHSKRKACVFDISQDSLCEGSLAREYFISRISCMGIMLSANLLACSLSLSSIAGGSTGSSLTSIFYGETSVNASECGLICLYHTMTLAAADEILHSRGFLYSSVWNVIAPAFHKFEISQDSLYRVASVWLQNECSSAGLGA